MQPYGDANHGIYPPKIKNNLKASTTVPSDAFSTSNGNKYKMKESETNK